MKLAETIRIFIEIQYFVYEKNGVGYRNDQPIRIIRGEGKTN